MSRISENIRKITRAWGGKTTGNGISDALLDLYNNLPFSVKKPLDYKFMPEGYPKVEMKMVEIMPEQSVTGEYMPAEDGYPAGYLHNMPMDIGLLKVGGKYTVVFNGKTYNVEAVSGGSESVWLPLDGIHDIMYFEASNEPVEWMLSIGWEEELGETITLAIYEEQEVVKQIDPKFVGGVTVYTGRDTDDFLYHFDEKTRTIGEKVSKEELDAAFAKGLIYITTASIETIVDSVGVLLTPIAGFISNIDAEYGEICFRIPENNELIWKQTSEYVSSGGGPQ